ncbi:hypothetical protein M426DRAFT_319114 [Hypoxylon sp. CI-4A]|nr:hypothetical protein M426DRAFT_319114 [Hypoxylon sp. CI-4A]
MHACYARPLARCTRAVAGSAAAAAALTARSYGRPSLYTGAISKLRQEPYVHQSRRNSTVPAAVIEKPQFSTGVDEAALTQTLEPLLASAKQGGRWVLIPGGDGLERSFKFKTFSKTWDFMTAVSLQCKLKNHHPEWSNVYNTTYIRWKTHDPKGLSTKDVELAGICDGLAAKFDEIVE